MHWLHIVSAIAGMAIAGCREAPSTPELEPAARVVKVGSVSVKILLPKGAAQDQSYPSSSRFVVPGRGGAVIILSFSGAQTLAEKSKNAAQQSTPDGFKPLLVRSEAKGGRTYVTSVAADEKLVRVSVTTPLSGASRGPHDFLSCDANVTRSSRLADPGETRRVLEAICESITEEL